VLGAQTGTGKTAFALPLAATERWNVASTGPDARLSALGASLSGWRRKSASFAAYGAGTSLRRSCHLRVVSRKPSLNGGVDILMPRRGVCST
jgi:hypothetical protein